MCSHMRIVRSRASFVRAEWVNVVVEALEYHTERRDVARMRWWFRVVPPRLKQGQGETGRRGWEVLAEREQGGL